MANAVKLQPIEKPRANIEIYKTDVKKVFRNYNYEPEEKKDIFYYASIPPGYQVVSFKRAKAHYDAEKSYIFELFFPYTHFMFTSIHRWRNASPYAIGSSWESLEDSDTVYGFIMTNDGCIGQQSSTLKRVDEKEDSDSIIATITDFVQNFFLYQFNTDWASGNTRFMKTLSDKAGKKTSRAYISIMREWEKMSEEELREIDLGKPKALFKRESTKFLERGDIERIF